MTRNQRRFNRLTSTLQQLRVALAAWQRAADRYRQRAAMELEPLGRELLAEQRSAVLLIDELLANARKGDRLTRSRKARLRALLLSLADIVLDAGPDDAVEAAFDRHSDAPHRELRRDQLELTEAMLGSILGEDFVQGHTAEDLDELFAQAGEHIHAEIEAEAAQHRAREQARRAASDDPGHARAREASQSVRDLFRRLAAAIHPDRELDPAERERKTALMQRVNQAYARNDLLELLTVQVEIEEMDAPHLAHASEQRLGHYCDVLEEQRRALEGELAAIQMPFRAALDLPPRGRPQLEMVDALIDRDARNRREVLARVRATVEALRDPSRRAAAIDAIDPGADPGARFEEADVRALGPPRSGRGKARGRRRR